MTEEVEYEPIPVVVKNNPSKHNRRNEYPAPGRDFYVKFKLQYFFLALGTTLKQCHYMTPNNTLGVVFRLENKIAKDDVNRLVFEAVKGDETKLILSLYKEEYAKRFSRKKDGLNSKWILLNKAVLTIKEYPDYFEEKTGITLIPKYKAKIGE